MALNPAQKRAYDSEAEENFRWLSSFLATTSSHVLTPADLLGDEIHARLSSIGQYAEMAHGSISPTFVFRHLEELCQPGYPLEEYAALRRDGARLIREFRGSVAGVQGYAALRPMARQLVLAFSGTSSPAQALKDVRTWRTAYPMDEGRSTVHSGFWDMYQGVRDRAFEALRMGFQEHGDEIEEVVLTGHSMGSTMCYLLALDLMAGFAQEQRIIPSGIIINLTVFGSPRLGNEGLAKYWRRCLEEHRDRFGEDSFREYSVKGYNDGVHTLPPCSLGFRHLTSSPLYSYHGRLYRVPTSECEHGAFAVTTQPPSSDSKPENEEPSPESTATSSSLGKQLKRLDLPIAWPRGGHNYYNDRDMERVQRRMRWLSIALHGEEGWKERYQNQLRVWEKKWGKDAEGVQ